MKICVFGLGYVGTVTAGCLAHDGHEVIGIDLQASKVDLVNRGRSPVIEKDIGEIIARTVQEGRLRATMDFREAFDESALSLVCVGTPSQPNGNLDIRHVQHVCKDIGAALRETEKFHVVVIRSTVLPGTTANVVIRTLEEASGKRAGTDFGVCSNPEFLREGSAVEDFYNPPRTVIGEINERSGRILASLYEKINAPLIRTQIEVAEMVKYTDNAWHALKIGFANEIGNICKGVGIDSHRVMDIFCLDEKLNLSDAYLKPGFAFGGSCLPKDLRALTYRARTLDLDLPILNAILPSNSRQLKRGVHMISERRSKKVSVLGFSFKAGTDDLRESPVVDFIEHLIGKGYEVRVYDRNVRLASLVGANRHYILNHIPHISRLMVEDIEAALDHADTIVIGNADPEFRSVPERLRPGQVLVDFVRIGDSPIGQDWYDGICW
jgi:GDP-mannose 6-dehydrogenase